MAVFVLPGRHSQYCWPLNTKQAALGAGCEAAKFRLRQPKLRRGAGAGRYDGAAGVTIHRLTVPG